MTYTLSPTGLALVQEFEGYHHQPGRLPDGAWLVGYGHVRKDAPGGAVSREQAAALLARDLAPVERMVNEAVTQTLNQSQFDALVSFAFSIGTAQFAQSQVLRRVNAGEFTAAACAMDAWRKSDVTGKSETLGALVARRAAEKALFLKQMTYAPAPSALVLAKLDHAASILGAPVGYACAPAMPTAPSPEKILTEILNAEPATLLLTERAPQINDEAEIATAHAKPVARRNGSSRFNLVRLMEHGGLLALMVFGLGLISIGASMLLANDGDIVAIAAGAAVATPGLAAALMAVFGLWRAPTPEPVKA